MKNELIRKYLAKLGTAESSAEIDNILDELVPLLKSQGVSIPDLMMYFKMYGNEIEVRSQDHRNTISNSNKAQVILQKLLAKIKK